MGPDGDELIHTIICYNKKINAKLKKISLIIGANRHLLYRFVKNSVTSLNRGHTSSVTDGKT